MSDRSAPHPITDSVDPLELRIGDATAPTGDGPYLIAHVCNDIGGWGRGFVLALSRRWPLAEQQYRTWYRDHAPATLRLGEVQFVNPEPAIWVANMVAQHGIGPAADGTPPIRYDALERCLNTTAARARVLGATVHMPRIGAGLAGGDWTRIEPMIRTALTTYGARGVIHVLPSATHSNERNVPS